MRRSEIPSLDDLRAFEAVARLSSVRLAADDLALTHGAVSRRVARLSQNLGFHLLAKSGRGVQLTPAGQTLQVTLGRLFTEIAVTVEQLRTSDAKRDALVLSCEPSVATRWLIPRLAGFQARHPEIAVHLSVGGGPVEFRRDRIALAIRRLDFTIPGTWHVQHLFAEQVGPVMAASQAASFSAGDYIALGSRTRPNAWQLWLSSHPDVQPPTEIRFYDHHFLMLEAASAGLGIAMSPFVLANDDIDRKRLVAPFGFSEDGTQYGLLWTGNSQLTTPSRALAEWLVEQIQNLIVV